ncbi:Enoyl-[acyl-carrier-protein] reductase [NADH], chloroplastic [Ancistrocladus abbreviatus]
MGRVPPTIHQHFQLHPVLTLSPTPQPIFYRNVEILPAFFFDLTFVFDITKAPQLNALPPSFFIFKALAKLSLPPFLHISALAQSVLNRLLLVFSPVGANLSKMAATAAPGLQMATARPCISSSRRLFRVGAAILSTDSKVASWAKLTSSFHTSSIPFQRSFSSTPVRCDNFVTKSMAESTDKPVAGLPINLKGKRAFIAGIADDNGYGWAIAKSLAAAGAEILVGTWVPALNIFETSLRRGKFDESRVLPDGSLMEISKIYPLDAVYDSPEDVPEDVKTNKRYAGSANWTVKEVAESVKQDFGSIDILVHSLANGPEVTKPLLETSRQGYLAALSASSYSYVSLLKHFAPIMNTGGSSISLTYIASERIIPGYGGGMSSAKAALESDTQVLAFEAGRKHKIRVNTISAGPLRSRAAKAIGFIDMMIDYSLANAPLQKELSGEEVGNTAAFLVSPLASAITGAVVYVDNGLNAMGVGVDSPIFESLDIPKEKK